MINIPTVMEVSAVRFRIICVTRLTVRTTTKGFTLAYQEGEAPSPAKRSTYFGIVAYSWCCTIQNPVIMMINVMSRPLLQTLIKRSRSARTSCPRPNAERFCRRTRWLARQGRSCSREIVQGNQTFVAQRLTKRLHDGLPGEGPIFTIA